MAAAVPAARRRPAASAPGQVRDAALQIASRRWAASAFLAAAVAGACNRQCSGCARACSVSPCSLLSAETATGVLPGAAVQVPAGTAWLPMRIDLSRFADSGGCLQENAIERALCRSVEIGELLHDAVHWPTARMRHDAWLNRRLAIIVTGFGDLVRRRGQDPADFASLAELSQFLRWAQAMLLRQSRAVAQGIGNLPALELTDPSLTLPNGQQRNRSRARLARSVHSWPRSGIATCSCCRHGPSSGR